MPLRHPRRRSGSGLDSPAINARYSHVEDILAGRANDSQPRSWSCHRQRLSQTSLVIISLFHGSHELPPVQLKLRQTSSGLVGGQLVLIMPDPAASWSNNCPFLASPSPEIDSLKLESEARLGEHPSISVWFAVSLFCFNHHSSFMPCHRFLVSTSSVAHWQTKSED
ncbi:hypothetical protein BKA61DRAFT_110220 [Leptodontidium sp. MPI-SDFR-AT-0119]|nr:hypothetical protein BKA61DRAFT_110220 [Leptodontidium sp. MPI-SDFR-AT-0119]